MTLRQALENAKRQLAQSQISEADNDAWQLMEESFGIDRTFYYMHVDDEADDKAVAVFEDYVKRRTKREPLQYILGKAYFMGYEFNVNEHVLIPRFDTEILVENAIKYIKDGDRILDMCTGSGCIAIALAKTTGASEVTAADISPDAIKVAELNVEKLSPCNVALIESDMFSNVEGKYNMIVSNPPYIPTEDISKLEPEVRIGEPMIALDGSEDGLKFYRIIARDSIKFLEEQGILMVEIGYNQAEAVKTLLEENKYTDIMVIKDLAGLDRVVCGRRM